MTQTTESFKQFLKTNLNPEQKKSVISKDGVFLVIAGAGSGKTRVITARISNLILEQGASPESIIALTFTNKAGKEMKERVQQFLPPGYTVPFVGTFHSYCLKLLKKYNELLEKPFISILDEDDKQKILNGIIRRSGLSKQTTAKKIAYSISKIKNGMIGSNIKESSEFQFSMPFIKDVFAAYEKEKTASKCFDFDDLLVETVSLFEKNENFKNDFQKKVKHILVDEYQDTNVIQHELLKHLCLDNKKNFKSKSLCIVGDEDQSIYSWRGATISNIINFKKDFPQTKMIKIEQNYRSVQPILDIANHVIKQNINRNPKKLWTDKKAKDRVRVITGMSEYQEGDLVATFLRTASKKQKLNSIAILYRAHYQSRAIEEALIRNTISYKIIGGIQFYERKEIKDILAYLRLSINPFDRASFFRVINCPTRGLGQKFEELFYERWHTESFFNFKDVAKDILYDKQITRTKDASLKMFLSIFSEIDEKTKPSKAIEHIVVAAAYMTYLKNSYEQQEAQARIDNVKELIRSVKYLEEQGTNTILQFLDEVALMQSHNIDDQDQNDSVLLMTLHAAKGLEFDTIIIVGMEDGLLPSSRSFMDSNALEEERRLFYVGITRAKEHLLLTHSKYRYTYGQMTSQPPSRFLAELPTTRFEHDDCSQFKTHNMINLFSDWLKLKNNNPKREIFTFGGASSFNSSSKKNVPFTESKKQSYSVKTSNDLFWKKNQPVSHKKFGIGIIQQIEKKTASITYLTVKFKASVKKLDAKFLKKV